jgi:hypothetical protein
MNRSTRQPFPHRSCTHPDRSHRYQRLRDRLLRARPAGRAGRPPNRRRLPLLTVCVLITQFAGAVPAYAAGPDPATARLDTILANATAWLVGILASLATLFLTMGGIRYVMAGGDPGEVEKAKGAFKSAGLGYALAALAPVIVSVIKSILGV